jgi:hypothetical protein
VTISLDPIDSSEELALSTNYEVRSFSPDLVMRGQKTKNEEL